MAPRRDRGRSEATKERSLVGFGAEDDARVKSGEVKSGFCWKVNMLLI